MLKPPTLTATQFLRELGKKCREFNFYLEKWFPRDSKYEKDASGRTLSRDELARKVLERVSQLYVERAAQHGGSLNRELTEDDLTARQIVNAWCYHWALREGFLEQQCREQGSAFNLDDYPDLDEVTLENLKFGRTFNSVGQPPYEKFKESTLKGDPNREPSYDDPIDDIVYVDLCYQNQELFAKRFLERFAGYLWTTLKNSRIDESKFGSDKDDGYRNNSEFTSCVYYVFMKLIRRTFLGLAGLQHWCARAFLSECRRRLLQDAPIAPTRGARPGSDGDDDELQLEPSVKPDLTDEDREVVEHYLKRFREDFDALPPELRLAIGLRFKRILNQGAGRPITRIAEFHTSELKGAGVAFSRSLKEMEKLVDAHKKAIKRLFEYQTNLVAEEVSANALINFSASLIQIVSSAFAPESNVSVQK